jgi:hypothetical protein
MMLGRSDEKYRQIPSTAMLCCVTFSAWDEIHSKAADVAAVLAERDKHIKTLEAENKRLRRLGECKFFCPITVGAGVCANISKGLVISEGLGHGGC